LVNLQSLSYKGIRNCIAGWKENILDALMYILTLGHFSW